MQSEPSQPIQKKRLIIGVRLSNLFHHLNWKRRIYYPFLCPLSFVFSRNYLFQKDNYIC